MSEMSKHYIIYATAEELKLSHMVAQSVELVDVFLSRVDSRFLGKVSEREAVGGFAIAFSLVDAVIRERDGGLLAVDSTAKLGIRAAGDPGAAGGESDSSPDRVWLELNVTCTAVYALPPVEVPESIGEAGLTAFARLNGAYHCWPFMREQLERLAWQVGRVPVVLPLMFIKQRTEPEAAPDGGEVRK